ncbi:hypothetical protein GCM10010277_11910 [Streptomyces longisporoflavus]|uniref:hypothetical protein n=1 Tax=Streptomyces longisporoflavus TaxID=28044 RepID=UPI00167CE996|nr:hypothetical protein [Streptomyces longisporoflavus]GGV29234.1 hypothetical protein GCM10010277_11910 [Streptomyces longisporoflavus]
MRPTYFRAESENGSRIDNPSEDSLFMLVEDLDDADNTFLVIQPDMDDPPWFATVGVLDEGGYEIVLRDASRREHSVYTETSVDRIANALVTWPASRGGT